MDGNAPLPFELLDHPGDLKLSARGASLEELFANAARGMMAFLFGDEVAELRAERALAVEIEAPDRGALLVDWLSELLFRATSEYSAYVDIRVHKVSERRLRATVGAVSVEAINDIKAVTHHELSLERRNAGWEATIVFDI